MLSFPEILVKFGFINPFKVIWWIYAVVFIILFLTSFFGRQLGLRKKYTQFLLKVFEFGVKKIEKKRQKKNVSSVVEEEMETPSSEYASLSLEYPPSGGIETGSKEFQLGDIIPYITVGMSTIVEDAVTPQFVSEELPYWNLLSRTNNRAYEFVSVRLTVFWAVGFIVRYFLLLPLRLIILLVGMVIFSFCTLIIGPVPDGVLKRNLNSKISIACFDFVAGSLSLVATFHNIENKPKSGVAVANHTSPIDSMILATDACYDMVGQKHGGLLGFFMTLLSRSSYHIWFDRAESKDRALVTKRLREHAANPDLPPILLFPEGVCVNNTSVMQFRKGAFEIYEVIHPIAIKFDPRFGDAFWWQDKFFSYCICMMTSWACVCDVWYLPPMKRQPNELSADFAKRVKAVIAQKGGLTDVSWDGFLKAIPIKDEWRQKHQLAYANRILKSPCNENVEELKNGFVENESVTSRTVGVQSEESEEVAVRCRCNYNKEND